MRSTEQSAQSENVLRFLLKASAVLAESLDFETTLTNVTQLVVPEIADWCSIYIADAQGYPREVATAHADQAKLAWADDVRHRYPPDPSSNTGVIKVLRTGTTELIPHISDAMLVASARDAEHLRLLRELGPRSMMLIPLKARGQTLGVIAFLRTAAEAHYTRQDVEIVEVLGHRIALAVENARLYREVDSQRSFYRTTLASIGDAVIATDRDGNVTFMNAIAETLTGWETCDALQRPLTQIFQIVDDQQRLPRESPVTRILREGGARLAPGTLLIARDGTERPIEDSGAPILDEHGTPTGIVLVFRDISARRRIEQTLAHFRFLFEYARDILLFVATDGTIIEANHAAQEAYGYSYDELRAMTIYALRDPATSGTVQSQMHAAEDDGILFETRHRRKDGTTFPVEVSSRGATIDGVAVLLSVIRDITERKQEQERQRFLAELSVELDQTLDYQATLSSIARFVIPMLADYSIVYVVDTDGAYKQVASHHRDPAKAALLAQLQQSHVPDQAEEHSPALQVLRTKASIIADATLPPPTISNNPSVLAAYEQLAPLSYMIVPLNAYGKVQGTIILATSESGRRFQASDIRLAEEVARRCAIALENAYLYHEAQEAIQVRDEFVAIAAHELRTPITGLIGFTQVLQRHLANRLDERDQRTVRMIVEQRRLLLQRHQMMLEWNNEPLMIKGDEQRLEQVMHNLIGNAIKFSPTGGQITIRLRRSAATVLFEIADEGIGIPDAAKARLFQRFFRASNATVHHIGGFGIGLYLVNEIVSLHGGTIDVWNNPERGTTFQLSFPVSTED